MVLILASLATAFLGGAFAGAIIPAQRRIMNDPKATEEARAVAILNLKQGYAALIFAVGGVVGSVVFAVLLAFVKGGLIPGR
jgi:hypothetical protein